VNPGAHTAQLPRGSSPASKLASIFQVPAAIALTKPVTPLISDERTGPEK
jgi:hypothetical protein